MPKYNAMEIMKISAWGLIVKHMLKIFAPSHVERSALAIHFKILLHSLPSYVERRYVGYSVLKSHLINEYFPSSNLLVKKIFN